MYRQDRCPLRRVAILPARSSSPMQPLTKRVQNLPPIYVVPLTLAPAVLRNSEDVQLEH